MRASPSFSSPSSGARFLRAVAVVVLAACVGACATVRPEEREYLAEPAMTFSSGGMTDAHQEHVLNNREGSYGGGSAKGGGCGCN